jgi:hypothetical protein
VSNRQAVIFIVRIPVKVLCVFRVLTPKVTCVLLQRMQLLVCVVVWLRARGNRDNGVPQQDVPEDYLKGAVWKTDIIPN